MLVAFVALGVSSPVHAQAEAPAASGDANSCVSQATVLPDDEHKGKTAAYVFNRCDEPVDMRICLMTESGKWNCGMTRNVAPQTSWSWSASKATGQVYVDARINGSNRALLSPK
jgi:hypothetical protein